MSEPKRLLESGADDFERELLASALPDRGSDRALGRTLASIGAGTAITLATAATANAASSALGAPAFGAAMVLKWLGIGAAVGLVTAGGVDLAMHRGGTTPNAAPPAPSHVAQVSPLAAAQTPAAAPIQPSSDEPQSARPSARPAAPPTAEGPEQARDPAQPSASVGALPTTVASSELLLREVRALDRAKSALASGNAGAALAALDEHARAFPRAALGPEADVLRVRALVASGKRDAGLGIARRVIAAQPASAHARAMRVLFPELQSNGTPNP